VTGILGGREKTKQALISMTQNEKREKPAKIIGSLKESTDHENPMNLDCKYTKYLKLEEDRVEETEEGTNQLHFWYEQRRKLKDRHTKVIN